MRTKRQVIINPSLLLCIRCQFHYHAGSSRHVPVYINTSNKIATIDLVRRICLYGSPGVTIIYLSHGSVRNKDQRLVGRFLKIGHFVSF